MNKIAGETCTCISRWGNRYSGLVNDFSTDKHSSWIVKTRYRVRDLWQETSVSSHFLKRRGNEDLRADRHRQKKTQSSETRPCEREDHVVTQSARNGASPNVLVVAVKINEPRRLDKHSRGRNYIDIKVCSPNSFLTMDIWSVEMKLESLSTLGVCENEKTRKWAIGRYNEEAVDFFSAGAIFSKG